MSELIEQALLTATDTKEIAIGKNVIKETGNVFKKLFPDKMALVVADDNTFEAAGEAVVASLTAAGVSQREPHIFPGKPTLYAGYSNVEKLREVISPFADTIVCSIASGTLNDIAKLASGELKRPYMNVCTAASVDGYAAFGASITRDGFKITRECPAPAGLIADYDVIAQAPARLTATGYGDLIEKIPAGADWILADLLGIEEIDDYTWSLVQHPLRGALADPAAIGQGVPEAISKLTEGNIMSGLAMQALSSSRPASGAGHQFSHTWEMEGHGLDWEPPLSHGFKVGIGTIASCALWEEFLRLDVANLDIDQIVENAPLPEDVERKVRANVMPAIADVSVKHSLSKLVQGEQLESRLKLLQEIWEELKERCAQQLLSPQDVMDRLLAVGAPHHPEMIKIDWNRFRKTHIQAQMIRPRYTVLDILNDLGALEQVVEHLFCPEGFWGMHRHP